MKYNKKESGKVVSRQRFIPWQPSTWPESPPVYNEEFGEVLRKIFHDSLIMEIENVIRDASSLVHRGHVVSLSILCAIDATSSYAFRMTAIDRCASCGRTDRVGPRYKKYIEEFFPVRYRPFAERIYKLYRNSITHSWNLFEATMLPGKKPIEEVNGTIILGLLHFFTAFKKSVDTFLDELQEDGILQGNALRRYKELKRTARP